MSKNRSPSCPCGSCITLDACCEPIILGQRTAQTAEQLMRSRYTAYVHRNEAYLLKSWHHSTRPDSLALDPAIKWIHLKIIESGGDYVEFVATHRIQGKAHKLHEKSRFVQVAGEWFYVDGLCQ